MIEGHRFRTVPILSCFYFDRKLLRTKQLSPSIQLVELKQKVRQVDFGFKQN